MIKHNLVQGSPEWHAHRATHDNASELPIVAGVSPYKSRSDHVREAATGIVKEIDVATQRLFNAGHHAEALARPLAEAIIDDDLYPVTGSDGTLSASFDGLTLCESIAWEHKALNAAIRAALVGTDNAKELPIMYRLQMEQQLMVSGAEKCLFSATKWDGDELIEEIHAWYYPDMELRATIPTIWAQFHADVASYQHTEAEPEVIAAPVMDLPALSIQVNGSISLISNLEKFGARLNDFVAKIDKEPTDDQGFADAESAIKTLQAAQDALEAAESNALAQTADIDDMRKTVKLYADTARTTRLMLEKMVKARKESLRVEIMQGGKEKLASHIAALNKRLGQPYMPVIPADFAGAVKNKRTIASLRESVNNELLRATLESSAIADQIEINLNILRELAKDHTFLFSDTRQLVMKANDDLVVLIKVRIAEHQQAEAAKQESLRVQMQAEEEAKARAKVEAEAKEAERGRVAEIARLEQEAAETQRLVDESKRKEEAAKHVQLIHPSRVQMIEAVASSFKLTYSEAEKCLRAEFAEVAA